MADGTDTSQAVSGFAYMLQSADDQQVREIALSMWPPTMNVADIATLPLDQLREKLVGIYKAEAQPSISSAKTASQTPKAFVCDSGVGIVGELPEDQAAVYRKEEEKRRRQQERKIIFHSSGERLRDTTERALKALVNGNEPPFVFTRTGQLVRVIRDEHQNPMIRPLGPQGTRHVLERVAEWWQQGTRSEFEIPPPMEVVNDLLELTDWGLPPLQGIIEAPTIHEDGSIVTSQGYDPDLSLYYAPVNDLKIDVPDDPTAGNVRDAVNLIREVFCDFPFDCEASRSNIIGALVSMVLRPIISGSCPLVIIDKPQAGTGATLMAETVSVVATGRRGAMMTAPALDEEWEKRITMLLMGGQMVVVVDNIEGRLYAPALAAAITSQVWRGRVLGKSEKVDIPNRTVWMATGNNIQLSGDMPRRCYWVRMDAQSARPWQRCDFRHPDLVGWTLQERGRILAAVLTMARAWIQAGRPAPRSAPLLGGFESWREVVGGVLEYSGIHEFLGNLEAMYEESDSETPQWEAFLATWYRLWRDAPTTVAEIVSFLERENDPTDAMYSMGGKLFDSLPDTLADAWYKKRSIVRVMGKALSRFHNRVWPNGLRIRKFGKHGEAVRWQVVSKTDRDTQEVLV